MCVWGRGGGIEGQLPKTGERKQRKAQREGHGLKRANMSQKLNVGRVLLRRVTITMCKQ